MSAEDHTVAVLGASPKADRYANQAIRLLKTFHYSVVPIHPSHPEIEGLPVSRTLRDVRRPIHTLTVYVGPGRSLSLADDIVDLKPGRVILNPGTESAELEERLTRAGIPVIRGCTLVMLHSGQFEPNVRDPD